MTDTETNAKIHEKVFGAKWYRATKLWLETAPHLEGLRWLYTERESATTLRHGLIELASGNEKPDELESIEKYSSDISEAFKVVTEMEAKGYLFEISNQADSYTDFKSYVVDIWLPRKSKGVTVDKSLPKAICLAALRAVGEKI
jgi:hypothetical protein